MCLQLSYRHLFHKKPFIAKKDIHVYKVLIQRKYHPYVFETPFQRYYVYFDLTTEIAIMNSELDIARSIGDSIYNGIHSFRYKTDAEGLDAQSGNRSAIFDAIIPKGSKYYIGDHSDIASDKLIVFRTNKVYNNYLTLSH